MLKHLFQRKRRVLYLVVAIAALAACAPFAKLAYLDALPMEGFSATSSQSKIHYEPGAERLAGEIAALYPEAIAVVEQTHGTQLGASPDVYICATEECYKKYAFVPIARGETRPSGKVIMLNGLKLSQDGTARAIFTHELSHVYWFTRGVRCLPRWWEEGLAVSISGGGGAEKAPLSAARQAIREGHVFHPSLENDCFFSNPAAKYGLDWPMYYRQSGMFVEFLRNDNPPAFNSVLEALRAKSELSDAIQKSYGQSIETLWNAWLSSSIKG